LRRSSEKARAKMAETVLQWEVVATEVGLRLDLAVRAHLQRQGGLEGLSRLAIRRAIEDGRCHVNGREVRWCSWRMPEGARIRLLWVDEGEVRVAPRGGSGGPALEVLYEDAWLIAVNKPSGLPTQGTLDARRAHLLGQVEAEVRARGGRYVGLPHRLDAGTSGVVLFAKNREINASLGGLFARGEVEKTYDAVVFGAPLEAEVFRVDNHLDQIKGSRPQRWGEVHAGGKRAVTDFVVRARQSVPGGEVAWVTARPLSGRTHQIRVHLAGLARAIVGDGLYGGRGHVGSLRVERLMLHASRLCLVHPVGGASLVIESGWEERFVGLCERLGLLAAEV